MQRLLVTGANGFVGDAIVRAALKKGCQVRAALRRPGADVAQGAEIRVVGPLSRETRWEEALSGVDAVIHCAARVHVMRESEADPLTAFRQVNVDATLQLARGAAEAGVRRFVFLSSIGVNGKATFEKPFTPSDIPSPSTPYAQSKYEAEVGLLTLSRSVNLEPVIIRAPLVYGPGAPGNFGRLVRAVQRGIPLPFASVRNKRSFVGVDNLADLALVCASHPRGPGEVFLVSDGEDLSTPDLLRRTALAFHTHARLLPVPLQVLRWLAARLGRSASLDQLLASLQVDTSKTRNLLGWLPQLTVDEELARTARYHLETGKE